jgi:L-rhamnose-H+ transport protein
MAAGFMNGTYAFPIKYMKSWKDENIWLVFSPIAFLLMPWLCLPIIDSNILPLISNMPTTILTVLILSGFLFGIGMIVFTFSLRYVGLGISFMLNISSSTVLATLLPILWMEPSKLFSWFGIAEISALILFCVAIITSYFASSHKSGKASVEQNTNTKLHVVRGVILGVLSGILTSAQGFSYAYATTNLKVLGLSYSDTTIMSAPWIPIFSAAFVPYFAYFLFRSINDKSLVNIFSKNSASYPLLCLVMGVLYFGSLLVFSQASNSFGHMGSVVAWPMLMIFIILTSNFWSFIHGEWKNSTTLALRYLSMSLLALVMAIVALSIAGMINR